MIIRTRVRKIVQNLILGTVTIWVGCQGQTDSGQEKARDIQKEAIEAIFQKLSITDVDIKTPYCQRLGVLCDDQGQVVFLDLSKRVHAYPRPPVPKEIGQLKSLEYLDLSWNGLSTLPSEIGQLTNLKGLNLSGNDLLGVPNEIGQLINLQYLDLSGNTLGSLPDQIGSLTNLQYLDLSINQLTGGIPISLDRLNQLVLLNVSANKLSDITLPPQLDGRRQAKLLIYYPFGQTP